MTDTGRIAGRWAIQAELGRGSMGRVVLLEEARAVTSAGDVPGRGLPAIACKVLERPELKADFIAEFQLARRLAHPSFVTPLRLVCLPEPPAAGARPRYLALMERAEGRALAPGAVSPGAVAKVAAALLEALDHLHRSDLVHGDLAPDNLLWDAANDRLTILDLGAGGARGARAGKTSGVLAYAAPERLEGSALAPAGDLFSCGVLLFGLAHGRHPWPGYPARRAATPDRAGLSAHPLDPLLDRLLAIDPATRPPSASAALAELETLLPDLPRAPRLFAPPASIDPRGTLEAAAADLAAAGRERRAMSLDIVGAPGSGRSRALCDLLERLAAEGVPGLEIPARDDDERTWIGDALAALGVPELEPRLGSLVRAIAATAGPVVLAVDDLDGTPAIRALLERLVQAMATVPEHYAGLLLVTVGLGAGHALALGPWNEAEVHESLQLRFPGRRVGAREVEALLEASRGNPGLLRAIVEEALRSGVMRADASQVVLDVDALMALSPPSLEALAQGTLAALDDDTRRVAAMLAWARQAVPNEAIPAAAQRELVRRGLASVGPAGLRLASEAVARAARPLSTQVEAAHALAGCYAAVGDTALALAHRLEAGDEVLVTAEQALVSASASAGTRLLEALLARPGWPEQAMTALDAARLAERWGANRQAATLVERAVVRAPEGLVRARALLALGRTEARAARYPKALEAFARALEEAALGGADARALVPEIRAGQARAAVLSGALDTARQAADEGLALVADTRAKAGLLYTRALVDWYRGELDAADTRLEEALAAAREAGERTEEAAIATAQGLVAHRRGDLDRAARCYGEAMRLGESLRDEARVLTALQNLGVLQHERGEWTEALDTYRHALAIAEELDARARLAQLAGNLGNLWRYLGETERAEAVLLRGQQIARADDNRHLMALIANLLGDTASDRGDLALAEARFREAIDIAEAAQCKPEAIEASLNLARLLFEKLDLKASRGEVEAVLAREPGPAMRVTGLAILGGVTRLEGGDGRALIEEAVAEVEAHKNPDGRWPIFLEAALTARDREDLATAERWAREVRKVLQAQLDAVPAAHRGRFRQRRDRLQAMRETAALVSHPAREADGGRALGWSRLLEVHKRLAGEHNVQRLLEYIMDSAILLTGAERGFLLLDTDAKDKLEVKVARNLDQENIRNKHLKISRGIARRVIQSGDPIVTVDAMEDERYREQLSVVDLRLRSIMCLPMAFRGRVLGAIYLDNRFRASAFSDEDLRFMEAFADMAAVALDSARLVESLEAQKKATEAARKEVEALNARLAQELEHRTRELEDTKVQMIEERRQLAEHRFDNIIGNAPSMRRVFQMIERLRNTDIPVLIEGESGTGKELVARAIHFSGQRRDRPFIAVNCGAIPATLLESELFGHVRGAFTNATADKKGLFEVAHTGTLFLDEIGEMPLEMQVKLLRVLQSGEIQKVGAGRQITVDVRIVAATNRTLEAEVQAGRFREDLFYRLSVVPLVVPPLRDRREDVPLLVQHFIDTNRKAGLGSVQSISKEALALLSRYNWPGNVRQLETVLKNATVFADGTVLMPRDLESFPDIVGTGGGGGLADKGGLQLQGRTLAELERLAIVQALKDNKGNKKRTAELLGIDRRTLYNKLAAYGIAIESDLKVT